MRNKRVVYTIIGIVSIALIALAITYAYWQLTKTQEGVNEITTACLDISLVDAESGNTGISLQKQYPLSDEEGAELKPYKFTVTNNCDSAVDYQIALESTGTSTTALSASSLKVMLDDKTSILSSNETLTPTVSGAYASHKLGMGSLAATGEIGASVTHEIRLWIDEEAPVEENNKTYTGKISVTIGQGIEVRNLKETILASYGGESAIDEIKIDREDKVVNTITELSGLDDTYAGSPVTLTFGNDYEVDLNTGIYTLSGTIVSATWEECSNGTKTCGKYLLYGPNGIATTNQALSIAEMKESGVDIRSTVKIDTDEVAGTGLYKAEDNYGISYFFRGDVKDNYVDFSTIVKQSPYRITDLQEGMPSFFGDIVFNSLATCISIGVAELGGTCEEITEEFYLYGSNLEVTVPGTLGFMDQDSCAEFLDSSQCEEEQEFQFGELTKNQMYWRIVRINGDGSIRLVYDGTELKENNELETAPTYQSGSMNWMYGNTAAKGAMDMFYSLYLGDSEYIADAYYCNDNTISVGGRSWGIPWSYSGAYGRIAKDNPTFKCLQESDTLTVNNGKLSNPIGMLTIDEVVLAGYGNNSYLRSGYWTMSPYKRQEVDFVYAVKNGIITAPEYGETLGYLPVINLKADVAFTGSGTIDDPYVIGE